MSVVLAVCGSNFCKFMSDGRLVRYDECKNIVLIHQESFPKVFKVNNNLLIGVSGDVLKAYNVVKEVMEHPKVNELSLEQIRNIIVNKGNSQTYDLLSVQILLGGKNSKNLFEFRYVQLKR